MYFDMMGSEHECRKLITAMSAGYWTFYTIYSNSPCNSILLHANHRLVIDSRSSDIFMIKCTTRLLDWGNIARHVFLRRRAKIESHYCS